MEIIQFLLALSDMAIATAYFFLAKEIKKGEFARKAYFLFNSVVFMRDTKYFVSG